MNKFGNRERKKEDGKKNNNNSNNLLIDQVKSTETKKELPRWHSGKECFCRCRRHKKLSLIPGSGIGNGMEIATHSSILAWKIPWTKEPGTLESMGLQRISQDRVTEYT